MFLQRGATGCQIASQIWHHFIICDVENILVHTFRKYFVQREASLLNMKPIIKNIILQCKLVQSTFLNKFICCNSIPKNNYNIQRKFGSGSFSPFCLNCNSTMISKTIHASINCLLTTWYLLINYCFEYDTMTCASAIAVIDQEY